MINQEIVKKMLVGLIVIIALAIGATLVISMFKKDETPQIAPVVESPIKSKTEVPQNKLPDKFPVNVPEEEGAEISQNYNASAVDGSFQATREFVTKKSLAENLTIYTEYLKRDGWIVKSTIDGKSYKMVSGSKDKQEIQVSIGENSATNIKTVSISLTQLP